MLATLGAIVYALVGSSTVVPFQTPRASVELVADKLSIKPGETFTAALHMKIPDGWHAYYVNPGESGAPPKISWQVPNGVGVGPLLWPTPQRFTLGGVVGNIYSTEVWLPIKIQTARTLPVGKILNLKAKASWLLCQEACVPDSADLSLSIRVTANGEADPFHQSDIANALASVPGRWEGASPSAKLVGKSVRLSLPGFKVREVPRFFGADPNFFGADDATLTISKGVVSLDIPLSRYASGTPKRLMGIVAPANDRPFYIDIPISRS